MCVVVVGRELRCGRVLATRRHRLLSSLLLFVQATLTDLGQLFKKQLQLQAHVTQLDPDTGVHGAPAPPHRRRCSLECPASLRLVLEGLLVICGFSSQEPGVFCATSLPFVQRLLARAETPKKTDPLVRVVWHANAVVLTKKSELAGALPLGAVRRAADGRVIAHLYEVQSSFERAVMALAQGGTPPPGLKGYAKVRCVCFGCGARVRRDRDKVFTAATGAVLVLVGD